jgi:DNA polymerase III sliding clamp (beta) subunit (PCNA family)
MIIKEAIQLAAKYTSKRPTHPVFACIRSTGTHLEACDLETAISIKIAPTPVFCANSELLKKTVAKLDKFAIAATDDAIEITGTGSSKIDAIDPAEFPALPEVKGESFTLWESKLFKAWSTVKPAINPRHTSRMLQGVSLKIRNNIATLSGTDGQKAAKTDFRVTAPDCSLIIPIKFFEILKAKSDRELLITHDVFNISMAISDIAITSRLLEGNYPELPSASENFAVLDREYRAQLINNLEIAKAMGSRTIDAYIRNQELILKCFTTDTLEFSGRIETPTPAHLFYFARAIANPAINYWSYSGGWTNPQTKERSTAHLYLSLKHEYICNTLCFTTPIAAPADEQARIGIDNLLKVLKTTDKDRDITITFDHTHDLAMIAIGSLGKNNASMLMASKEAPAPYSEVIDIRTGQAIAA